MYPKLRFKGFDDAWEQRKFDDVFNYLAHNSLSRDDLNDNEGSIKNIHYGDVLIKFGNVIDTKHEYIPYVNDNVKLENKACFLQDGDVVIADAAEDSTVGKCTEISESSDQKIVSGLHTIPCRPKNKFAKGFLGYYLNSNAYHDQLLPLMQGTKVSSISKTSLKETTIKFPSSIEEQKKVGACFHELDNLITLHQRQCEALKKQKRFFLQNMFPKEGESEPRIRFNGFTEPWEQRKFKDFTKQTGIRNKENLDLEPYSITNETGFVPQKDAHDEFGYMKNTDRSAYSIVSPNSFAYNPARINVGSIGYYKGDKNVIVSSLYEVFQTDKDIDDSFLWIWFKSSNFFNWINKLQEGSVRQYFYYDKLCECKLPVPSLKEQEKIGTFFSKLDNLITLHQRQYEQIYSLMKYLLSKMFI